MCQHNFSLSACNGFQETNESANQELQDCENAFKSYFETQRESMKHITHFAVQIKISKFGKKWEMTWHKGFEKYVAKKFCHKLKLHWS